MLKLLPFLLLLAGCLFEPEEYKLTARIYDVVVEADNAEVFFTATVKPAETIYYHVRWVSLGNALIDFGKQQAVESNENSIIVAIAFFSSFPFHLEFTAWTNQTDSVAVTFMNIP
jgi:hypothetical protein